MSEVWMAPERDYPPGRKAQHRAALLRAITARSASPLTLSKPHVWRIAAAAIAVGLVLAVAVPVLIPAGDHGGAPRATAAETLRATAHVATLQPSEAAPTPGQYLYKETKRLDRTYMEVGERSWTVQTPHTEEMWISPDGSGRQTSRNGQSIFPTEADRESWEKAGSPRLFKSHTNHVFRPGGLSFQNLWDLPSDPDELRELIEERRIIGGPPGERETFTLIGDLLAVQSAPGEVRAALYEIASTLPGVVLLGETTDHSGRSGVAVGYVNERANERHDLIFDPNTSALLAKRDVDLASGKELDWVDYLSSGVVDSIHESP